MTRKSSGMLRLTPEVYDRWQAKCPVCGFERLWCNCPKAEGRPTAKPSSRKPVRVVASEAETQVAVLAFLRKHPKIAFAVRMNSGMAREQNADGTERVIRYGFRGCPDVWAMLRGSGRLLVVEVKRDGKRPTDDQQAVLDAVNGGGGIGVVAYRLEDVANALEAA